MKCLLLRKWLTIFYEVVLGVFLCLRFIKSRRIRAFRSTAFWEMQISLQSFTLAAREEGQGTAGQGKGASCGLRHRAVQRSKEKMTNRWKGRNEERPGKEGKDGKEGKTGMNPSQARTVSERKAENLNKGEECGENTVNHTNQGE